MADTSEARARLIADYPYFLRVISRVVTGFPQHLRSEGESAAMVALVEAADEYVQNGVSFRQFVSRRIEQRMTDEVRRLSKFGRAHRSGDEVSLDTPLSRDSDDGTRGEQLEALGPSSRDPHSIAVARETIDEASADLDVLPARWRIALTRSTPDAVELLGVTESRVFQLRTAARQLLEGTRPVAADHLAAAVGLPITHRELAVLHLVASGGTNVSIGEGLHISVETVKKHIKHVIEKLHAENRAHAVDIAWLADWWGEPNMGDRRPDDRGTE
jgi:DNA-binding CsgD family transcriptional regulator